jgi:hypothetical protein
MLGINKLKLFLIKIPHLLLTKQAVVRNDILD